MSDTYEQAGGRESPRWMAGRLARWRAEVAADESTIKQSDVSEPWALVERLGDALLDEVLTTCAEAFYRVMDEAVERVASSELSVARGVVRMEGTGGVCASER